MSKRKSSSQSLQVKSADMVFEDDDEIFEDQQSVASDSNKGSVSRVSGRAKKAKAIYDPSEYNGPVHKRKKEAMEAERSSSSKSAPKTVKQELTPKSPPASPIKSQVAQPAAPATDKVKTPVKAPVPKPKPVVEIKKIEKPVESKKPAPHVRKISMLAPIHKTVSMPVAASKEPSKRIQARKVVKADNSGSSSDKKNRMNSASTEDYEKASTIEFAMKQVPDVVKWSHQQVFEYFCNNLGFSKSDSAVFNDEEIDGEALMIMKRSDIVNAKFQKLKLGTALKMWSNIIMFQTGSNDPTQAWK